MYTEIKPNDIVLLKNNVSLKTSFGQPTIISLTVNNQVYLIDSFTATTIGKNKYYLQLSHQLHNVLTVTDWIQNWPGKIGFHFVDMHLTGKNVNNVYRVTRIGCWKQHYWQDKNVIQQVGKVYNLWLNTSLSSPTSWVLNQISRHAGESLPKGTFDLQKLETHSFSRRSFK